jgi:hypothetical protein
MKTLARLIIILFLFGISGFIPKEVTAQEIIYGEFYDGLSPNGHWVNYPPYGYVWIPATYSYIPKSTNGHWVYTDDGWLWKSNYDWGKAPFRYPCWNFDQAHGWYFVPDIMWGLTRANTRYLEPGIVNN